MDEFAFHHEPALGGTGWQQMKSPGAFELLQLAGAANDLPHSIVQELRLAVRPGDEHRLDNRFHVGLVAIRRSEFQIAARLAANTRHHVVSAIFLNRRAGERTLTFGLAFPSDQQEEVLAWAKSSRMGSFCATSASNL